MKVANAPGTKIGAGELTKGLEILRGGGDIDYVGASRLNLFGPGEASVAYREVVMKGGKDTTVAFR